MPQDTGQEHSEGAIRQPGQESYRYFMGGANAGEVLTAKSPIVFFDEGGRQIAQFTFQFQADPADPGDLGFARNIAVEHGLSVLTHDQVASMPLGNMPHWRTFTKTPEGLYVSEDSGMHFENHRDTPDLRNLKLVTQDQQLASALFRDVHEVPQYAKGRQVFEAYASHWKTAADRIQLDKPRTA